MPTVPGYAQVSIQLTLTGLSRPSYITFGVDPTSTVPLDVAAAVITAMTGSTSLQGALDSNVALSAVRVSLGTDGAEDIVGVLPSSIVGTLGQSSFPPNVALLCHKVTERGGRRGRGRLFIPWAIDEAQVDEAGIITPAALTAKQTAITGFKNALTANQVPMVVLHDPSPPGTVHPTPPGAPNVVTFLQVDKLISTQRRRLGRR